MKKLAYSILALILLITAFFAWRMSKVTFDYDFEKFFPGNDPDTEFFREFRDKFESDNDFVLFGIRNEAGVFQQDFLVKVDSLSAELQRIPYCTGLISLLNYKEMVMPSFSRIPFLRPAIHSNDPSQYAADSAKLFREQLLVGTLISADGKSLALVMNTRQYISKKASDSLAVMINAVVDRYSFDEMHIAGRATGQSYYVKLMQYELGFFALTSILLVLIFLWFSFRTFWGLWVPVVVVVFTAIWIIGFMELVGEGINLVLTILPTIMFVVGMSDVVHIISKYVDELRDGRTKMEALRKTYKEVALATFLTSVTTAIGFLSLLTSSIEPVRDFGIYTALGVMFAFVLAYTLLPAVLILHPVPSIAAVPHENNWWRKMLPRLLLFIFKRRNALLISSGLLILLSFIGISQMRINNFLLEDLKEGNELKQHFRFFETEFSGVRPFELALQKNTGSDSLPLTVSELQQIEKIETYLHQEYGAGFLFSPLSIVKTVNRSLHGGDFSAYAIPSSNEELLEIYSLLEKMKSKNAFDRVVADQGKLIRISGKSADLGSFVYKEKDAAFHSFFKEQIDTTLFSYRITGTATLIDKNNGQVARGLVYGLLLSFLVIALIVGLMYKSLSMTIIALIPNIIPLLLVAGIMGILGVDLKVSTSMIFTISFGIAVDDTIHFISKLRLELAAGKSVFYAVKRTFLTTGRAIILTTIILSGGFLTLVFSDFLGTFYLGLLIALTLIFAVLADLFLLPVLVVYFYKRK